MENVAWFIQQVGGMENLIKLSILILCGILGANIFTAIYRKLSFGFFLNSIIGIVGAVGGLYLLQTYFDIATDISLINFDNEIDYMAGLPLAGFGLAGAFLLVFILGLVKQPFSK